LDTDRPFRLLRRVASWDADSGKKSGAQHSSSGGGIVSGEHEVVGSALPCLRGYFHKEPTFILT
jgi:hypothetical protein